MIVEVNVSNHDVLCLVLNGCLATAGFYYTKTRLQTVDSLGLNPANCWLFEWVHRQKCVFGGFKNFNNWRQGKKSFVSYLRRTVHATYRVVFATDVNILISTRPDAGMSFLDSGTNTHVYTRFVRSLWHSALQPTDVANGRAPSPTDLCIFFLNQTLYCCVLSRLCFYYYDKLHPLILASVPPFPKSIPLIVYSFVQRGDLSFMKNVNDQVLSRSFVPTKY